MLIANGENVKVVQELMRHANSRTTSEVYSQARIREKREAQQRLGENDYARRHKDHDAACGS
jgi:integrase